MIDKKFRLPRLWSNKELRRFAPLFSGKVINVSAWRDKDKEGKEYKDYFVNARKYFISNWKEKSRGLQNRADEICLDLSKPIPKRLNNEFDVVFNHTTLEHIYEVKTAFKNLCALSKDIVIVVVPFLQPMHAKYGDYWRFTPLTIKKLFEENKMDMLYVNFNNDRHSSVYLFAIGSKKPQKWKRKIPKKFTFKTECDWLDTFEPFVGCRAITNSFAFKVQFALARICSWFK